MSNAAKNIASVFPSAKTLTGKIAAIESLAKAAIENGIGRPCVHVTIGDDVIVTEWLTSDDAERAGRFFIAMMGKAIRISYDSDLGWVCEAAEAF